MPSSAFPSVIAAVQTVAAAALPALRVVRGGDVSDDPGDVVMIGVQGDVETTSRNPDTVAGYFEQTMQTFGGNREEVGTVRGLVLASNGDADQDAACAAAFDHLAALEAAVRADPTLGLTAFNYVVAEMRAGEVSESQNQYGATTAVSFSIDYKVRI